MTVFGLLISIVEGLTLVGRVSVVGPLVYFRDARRVHPVLFMRLHIVHPESLR